MTLLCNSVHCVYMVTNGIDLILVDSSVDLLRLWRLSLSANGMMQVKVHYWHFSVALRSVACLSIRQYQCNKCQ